MPFQKEQLKSTDLLDLAVCAIPGAGRGGIPEATKHCARFSYQLSHGRARSGFTLGPQARPARGEDATFSQGCLILHESLLLRVNSVKSPNPGILKYSAMFALKRLKRLKRPLRPLIWLASSLAAWLVSGCASPVPVAVRIPVEPEVSVVAVQQAEQEAIGSLVRWGGRILEVRNTTKTTRVFILSAPLTEDGQPMAGANSSGRFIAELPGFRDPTGFPIKRNLTVLGSVVGLESHPIGEFDYPYPVIDVQAHYLWPVQEPAIRPMLYPGCRGFPGGPFGPGGYCGPFWYGPGWTWGYGRW